jgi:fatty aldehyde-generating acyl-ACP reductase
MCSASTRSWAELCPWRGFIIPVTTGGSYTVAMAVQAARAAAECLEVSLARSTIAVLGAAGAVRSVSARLLARECAEMVLIGLPRSD